MLTRSIRLAPLIGLAVLGGWSYSPQLHVPKPARVFRPLHGSIDDHACFGFMSPSSATIYVGYTQQMLLGVYACYPGTNTIDAGPSFWKDLNSNNTSVVSYDQNSGYAIGVAPGTATVGGSICFGGSCTSASATVTVTYAPVSVEVRGTSYVTSPGSYNFTSVASGGHGTYSYQWSVTYGDGSTFTLGTGTSQDVDFGCPDNGTSVRVQLAVTASDVGSGSGQRYVGVDMTGSCHDNHLGFERLDHT
jgi:hypothetical protein